MNIAIQSQAPRSPDARWRRWLSQAAQGAWRAMEATGRARAQRHLLEFAYQCEALQPELAKELRAASLRGTLS